jgi:hypothetical protein
MAESPYAVEGVQFYRCPGEVTFDQHKGHSDNGLLDGCYVYVGLKDVEWKVGGRVHCVHCGSHAQPVRPGEVAPAGKLGRANASVFILERAKAESFREKSFDTTAWQWGCCMNKQCSQHYLEAQPFDSDATRVDTTRGTAGPTHSATQYMLRNPDALPDGVSAGNRWAISSKLTNRPEGKAWRRCLFCGALMATSEKEQFMSWPLRNQRVKRRELESDDEAGWTFHGPAATFRIYRWSEWLAHTKEPVVALEK